MWWVEPGPPLTLIVRMLPGQVVDDFRAEAHRLALGMGVPMVRVGSHRHGWLRVALLCRCCGARGAARPALHGDGVSARRDPARVRELCSVKIGGLRGAPASAIEEFIGRLLVEAS